MDILLRFTGGKRKNYPVYPVRKKFLSFSSSAFCLQPSAFRSLSPALFLFCLQPLAFSLFLLLPSLAFAEQKSIGKVIGIIGTVEYLAAENTKKFEGKIIPVSIPPWEPAVFRQPVFEKDKFRTKQASRLKVVFSDNSLMAIGPNSAMSIESYEYKPKQKLRRGLISVAHGLSMYLVNKNQTNKNSSFNILSTTGNIAIRGTQGYISTTPDATLIANQTGAVEVSNSDPGVKGTESVGEMMKTVIREGQPPVPPVELTKAELQQIRNVVIGRTGASGAGGGDSLISVEEDEVEEEEEETEEEGKEESSEEDVAESEEGSEEGTETEGSETEGETETAEAESENKTDEAKSEDKKEGKEKKTEGKKAEGTEAEGSKAEGKTGTPTDTGAGTMIVADAGQTGGGRDMTVPDIGQTITDMSTAITDAVPINNPFDTSFLSTCKQ